jgi:hypothetical protein
MTCNITDTLKISCTLITLASDLEKNRVDIKNRNFFIAANNFSILTKNLNTEASLRS